MKTEVFKGKDGWRWRLRADNGEILASSEAYFGKDDAIRSAKLVQNNLDGIKHDEEIPHE